MKQSGSFLQKMLNTTLKWIRVIFFVLGKLPFLLILIGVSIFGFVINDQGQDLMAAFGQLSLFHPYVLSFIALLITWAGVCWYVARIILGSANLRRIVDREVDLKDSLEDPDCGTECRLKEDHSVVAIDGDYRDTIRQVSKVLPRMLAAVPYLVFMWGFLAVNGFNSGTVIQVLVVFLIGTLHIIYLCYRTTIFTDKNKNLVPEDRFSLQGAQNPGEVIRRQHLRTTTRIIIPLVFVGVFAYAWYTARSVPSLDGKPGLIILCGLIFYTILSLFLDGLSNKLKFPFFFLLIIVMLFLSLPRNNNHALREYKDSKAGLEMIRARKQDTVFTRQWLMDKWKNGRLTSRGDTIPVFIVAAEGGGIRACYWTTQVMKQLHFAFPELYQNTFAVTGASGGTVGLSFFYNYLYQLNPGADIGRFTDPAFYQSLDTIAGADFLSGVTYGFLFPDLIQRAIPFPIRSFDRAKFLNNGFEAVFSKHVAGADQGSVMNDAVIRPWMTDTAHNYPLILYNSLFVEQGQKAIFSPIRLSETWYRDVLDIFDTTRVMVTTSEAMVSSARFPIITPPGLLKSDTHHDMGHLVDGGYFENTAVQTAQQTAIMIKKIGEKLDFGGKKVVPIIISLKYGSGIPKFGKALGWNYEAAPVVGGLKTLFRWIDAANAVTANLDNSLISIDFRLPRYKGDIIPLGWYLSDTSRALIKKYSAPSLLKEPMNKLKRYLPR